MLVRENLNVRVVVCAEESRSVLPDSERQCPIQLHVGYVYSNFDKMNKS